MSWSPWSVKIQTPRDRSTSIRPSRGGDSADSASFGLASAVRRAANRLGMSVSPSLHPPDAPGMSAGATISQALFGIVSVDSPAVLRARADRSIVSPRPVTPAVRACGLPSIEVDVPAASRTANSDASVNDWRRPTAWGLPPRRHRSRHQRPHIQADPDSSYPRSGRYAGEAHCDARTRLTRLRLGLNRPMRTASRICPRAQTPGSNVPCNTQDGCRGVRT